MPMKLLSFVSVGLALALAAPASGRAATAAPTTIPGAETHVLRATTPAPVLVHVFKPKQWRATDRRPAFIWFFGGGFVRGTVAQSAGWAKRAAQLGFVGIAPDYRTHERFGTDGRACVADARLALHWVQAHADELGVDPKRVVVGGSSAGGHLALWTAITETPPGLDPQEAPLAKPIALLLCWPAADTSSTSGLRGDRFAGEHDAFSPLQHLDAKMPPALLIHGDADTVVPYRHAVALHAALVASGNECEFITAPKGQHGLKNLPAWKQKVVDLQRTFLTRHGLLPVSTQPPTK